MTNPDSITLNTVGGGEENLLAFRDSFGILLYPYLADSYANARFSRANAYTLMHSKGFPTIKIGKRMVVPKNKLIEWMEAQTAS